MKNSKITVIDYGVSNLKSVINAIDYLGYRSITSENPKEILNADMLLLPGVGSFKKAMISLKKSGIDEAIIEAVKIKGKKILGICLGMQLLSESSTEDGFNFGLNLVKCNVEKFSKEEIGLKKIPHIGFDLVSKDNESILFRKIGLSADFYFAHSYRILPNKFEGIYASCNYGTKFVAAFECNNIFATQFHPEKSQTNGLILLKNFILH